MSNFTHELILIDEADVSGFKIESGESVACAWRIRKFSQERADVARYFDRFRQLAVVLERCVGQKLKPLDCLGTNRSDTNMSAPRLVGQSPKVPS
jgi:hypothetical protein